MGEEHCRKRGRRRHRVDTVLAAEVGVEDPTSGREMRVDGFVKVAGRLNCSNEREVRMRVDIEARRDGENVWESLMRNSRWVVSDNIEIRPDVRASPR